MWMQKPYRRPEIRWHGCRAECPSPAAPKPSSASDPQRIALLADRLAATLRCGDALLDADSVPDSTPPVTPPVAWNRAFPAVFQRQNPGFDVVLGNPPYVNIRVLTRSRGPAVKRYFQQRYRSASGSYDLYVLFMERAFQLLREGGRCGMIVPNKIAALDYARTAARCSWNRPRFWRSWMQPAWTCSAGPPCIPIS